MILPAHYKAHLSSSLSPEDHHHCIALSLAKARPEPRVRAMDVYGTGNEPWFFATEADTGAFSVESVTGPSALAKRGSRGFIARSVLERWLRLWKRGRWRS
ncbi:hypothetical protein GJ744_010666 [Endocarpon pusillum]|uniref:Uncharacterized protein n=1 Tax=Endocarpon pusillum TaxID=364733 RepID=A0A8H7AH56_9EURO|nr:hypothetical protein GJ744_010666 [Endocarpon pusillum]